MKTNEQMLECVLEKVNDFEKKRKTRIKIAVGTIVPCAVICTVGAVMLFGGLAKKPIALDDPIATENKTDTKSETKTEIKTEAPTESNTDDDIDTIETKGGVSDTTDLGMSMAPENGTVQILGDLQSFIENGTSWCTVNIRVISDGYILITSKANYDAEDEQILNAEYEHIKEFVEATPSYNGNEPSCEMQTTGIIKCTMISSEILSIKPTAKCSYEIYKGGSTEEIIKAEDIAPQNGETRLSTGIRYTLKDKERWIKTYIQIMHDGEPLDASDNLFKAEYDAIVDYVNSKEQPPYGQNSAEVTDDGLVLCMMKASDLIAIKPVGDCGYMVLPFGSGEVSEDNTIK